MPNQRRRRGIISPPRERWKIRIKSRPSAVGAIQASLVPEPTKIRVHTGSICSQQLLLRLLGSGFARSQVQLLASSHRRFPRAAASSKIYAARRVFIHGALQIHLALIHRIVTAIRCDVMQFPVRPASNRLPQNSSRPSDTTEHKSAPDRRHPCAIPASHSTNPPLPPPLAAGCRQHFTNRCCPETLHSPILPPTHPSNPNHSRPVTVTARSHAVIPQSAPVPIPKSISKTSPERITRAKTAESESETAVVRVVTKIRVIRVVS